MTAALVALLAALGGIGVLHVVSARQWATERRTLLAAVMSRHAGEFAAAAPVDRRARGLRAVPQVEREDVPNEHEMIGVGGV